MGSVTALSGYECVSESAEPPTAGPAGVCGVWCVVVSEIRRTLGERDTQSGIHYAITTGRPSLHICTYRMKVHLLVLVVTTTTVPFHVCPWLFSLTSDA